MTFWERVQMTDTCWLWTGHLNKPGAYGHMRVGGSKKMVAHRVSYESVYGAIPDGLELDHTCRVHRCVNPAHLEPVTHAENIRRGAAARVNKVRNAARTHCFRGHELSEDNVYRAACRGTQNSRGCKTCIRHRHAEYRATKGGALC